MGDGFHPFTEPRMRAMQMMAFKQDIDARKEQRDMNRQKYLMEIEDRKRRQAIEDFQTGMALDSSGLLPVEPGIVGKFRAGTGGRGTVDVPGFGQRSVPTPTQQQERAYGAAQAKGVAAGITKRAEKDIADPFVDIESPEAHPMGGHGTLRVRESEQLKTREAAYKHAYPDLVWTRGNDGKGNMTLIGSHPKTGETKVRQVLQGIVAPSANEKPEKPDYEAEVVAASGNRSNDRERRITEMMPWAYGTLQIKGEMKDGKFITGYYGDDDKPTDWGTGKPTEASSEQAERARKLAEANVDRAMKEEMEQAVAQRKAAGRTGAGTTAKRDPFARTPAKSAIPASRLTSLLKHPSIQSRGIRDVNALRKDLMKYGYTIEEGR